MILKWVKLNKYKLIILGMSVYLLADLVLHKGLVRVMIPQGFPGYKIDSALPQNKNRLTIKGKEWKKAINSLELMDKLDKGIPGWECDIYFDREKHYFDVHHDEGKSIGLNLDELFQASSIKGLHSSVWLDFKNLEEANAMESLTELDRLKDKYGMNDRILVESSRADLLKPFSQRGYFTSFYVPLFNPYLIGKDAEKEWVDSLSRVINISVVSAMSGYYFQYPLLHHFFPNYPILTWSPNDRFSMVNWLFKRKQAGQNQLFIALYP